MRKVEIPKQMACNSRT